MNGDKGPELVTTVDDGDSGGKFGQMKSLKQGGITATDYGNVLIGEKGGITGGTIGDAPTGKFFFPGDTKLEPVRAAGDN